MSDEEYMRLSLVEAAAAAAAGEVPIGAVVVRDGQVLARAGNRTIVDCDPTAHAEIIALRRAAAAAGNHRLPGADVYVTVEPCMMCVGALIQARVRTVIFACADAKAGFLGSVANGCGFPQLNHRFAVRSGVAAVAAAELLREFFRHRRG